MSEAAVAAGVLSRVAVAWSHRKVKATPADVVAAAFDAAKLEIGDHTLETTERLSAILLDRYSKALAQLTIGAAKHDLALAAPLLDQTANAGVDRTRVVLDTFLVQQSLAIIARGNTIGIDRVAFGRMQEARRATTTNAAQLNPKRKSSLPPTHTPTKAAAASAVTASSGNACVASVVASSTALAVPSAGSGGDFCFEDESAQSSALRAFYSSNFDAHPHLLRQLPQFGQAECRTRKVISPDCCWIVDQRTGQLSARFAPDQLALARAAHAALCSSGQHAAAHLLEKTSNIIFDLDYFLSLLAHAATMREALDYFVSFELPLRALSDSHQFDRMRFSLMVLHFSELLHIDIDEATEQQRQAPRPAATTTQFSPLLPANLPSHWPTRARSFLFNTMRPMLREAKDLAEHIILGSVDGESKTMDGPPAAASSSSSNANSSAAAAAANDFVRFLSRTWSTCTFNFGLAKAAVELSSVDYDRYARELLPLESIVARWPSITVLDIDMHLRATDTNLEFAFSNRNAERRLIASAPAKYGGPSSSRPPLPLSDVKVAALHKEETKASFVVARSSSTDGGALLMLEDSSDEEEDVLTDTPPSTPLVAAANRPHLSPALAPSPRMVTPSAMMTASVVSASPYSSWESIALSSMAALPVEVKTDKALTLRTQITVLLMLLHGWHPPLFTYATARHREPANAHDRLFMWLFDLRFTRSPYQSQEITHQLVTQQLATSRGVGIAMTAGGANWVQGALRYRRAYERLSPAERQERDLWVCPTAEQIEATAAANSIARKKKTLDRVQAGLASLAHTSSAPMPFLPELVPIFQPPPSTPLPQLHAPLPVTSVQLLAAAAPAVAAASGMHDEGIDGDDDMFAESSALSALRPSTPPMMVKPAHSFRTTSPATQQSLLAQPGLMPAMSLGGAIAKPPLVAPLAAAVPVAAPPAAAAIPTPPPSPLLHPPPIEATDESEQKQSSISPVVASPSLVPSAASTASTPPASPAPPSKSPRKVAVPSPPASKFPPAAILATPKKAVALASPVRAAISVSPDSDESMTGDGGDESPARPSSARAPSPSSTSAHSSANSSPRPSPKPAPKQAPIASHKRAAPSKSPAAGLKRARKPASQLLLDESDEALSSEHNGSGSDLDEPASSPPKKKSRRSSSHEEQVLAFAKKLMESPSAETSGDDSDSDDSPPPARAPKFKAKTPVRTPPTSGRSTSSASTPSARTPAAPSRSASKPPAAAAAAASKRGVAPSRAAIPPPARPDSNAHWPCPVCTFLNSALLPLCEMCNAIRPADK